MDFYQAQGKMSSLLTGDIARETLEIAEDENGQFESPKTQRRKCTGDNFGTISRDVPPGEDIKWMCGDCGSTDWTPNHRQCPECKV